MGDTIAKNNATHLPSSYYDSIKNSSTIKLYLFV